MCVMRLFERSRSSFHSSLGMVSALFCTNGSSTGVQVQSRGLRSGSFLGYHFGLTSINDSRFDRDAQVRNVLDSSPGTKTGRKSQGLKSSLYH